MWRIIPYGCFLFASSATASNPRVEFAWGVLCESRGDAAAAVEHFDKALAADPTAATLVTRKVEDLLDAGDRAAAIALFRRYAAARTDDLASQLGYADFLVGQGKGDALANKLAVGVLDSALERNPGHPEIIRRLFSLDRSRGIALLGLLAANDPEATLLFVKLSESLHEADDVDSRSEVDRRLLLALKNHPAHVLLARETSEHFRKTGRIGEAIEALKIHTSAAPWSLDLRVRLGVLCFSNKMDAEGESFLKELLVIHPRHPLAHQSLAKFYRLRGEAGQAAYHSGELLKISGGAASDFIKLADEHIVANRPRDARLLLEKAVFDYPENTQLRMKLAIATHQDQETKSRAPRLFREAEAVAGDGKISDTAFLTTSAEVFIESGQSKAGEERLRAAIRAFPPDAKKETAAALRRLAGLWNAENRNAEPARALLLRADSLDPK